MVETFSSDRADNPLDMAILPGRSGRNRTISNAHSMGSAPEDLTIGAVIVANEKAWRRVPREGLGNLPGKPLCCRVGCDPDPKKASSADAKHNEREQALKIQRRDNQKIDRCNSIRLIAKEDFPALRRRS